MNRVRLDFDDNDIKSALADCVVGEPKTLTITVTPEDIGEGYIEGELDSLKYKKKPKKATEYEEGEDDDETPAAVKSVKIKASSDAEEM